jgi:chloride channel protein, CIC family
MAWFDASGGPWHARRPKGRDSGEERTLSSSGNAARVTNSDGPSSSASDRQVRLLTLTGLALLVGCAAGVGAILFRYLIAAIHNLFFYGTWSFAYDANQLETVGPWGPLIILAPVIGGMGVIFLVKNFAPEAKGHGVPEVMYAIYHKEGRIRPIVALVKSLASALSIGSGAAVGREGPIIQIGSSFGSTLGQIARLAVWQRNTLIAAGAGAGIAATFNTPLGGVMFAVELMLPEVSARTFLPVVMATGTAAYIGQLAFGLQPAFFVPQVLTSSFSDPFRVEILFASVVLGVLCGLAAAAFVRLLVFMEDAFPKISANEYVQHAIGMLILGVMMYLLAITYGHYFISGVGYGTIQAILSGGLSSIVLLALLFVLKLLATTISLGSGSSGGIFSPSLYIGATLGGAFGAVVEWIWKIPEFGIPAFAMMGMAGVVGGGTGAMMTGILMIFEMTGDYNIIIPLIIAVGCAIGTRRTLMYDNIYTIKLAQRGIRIPKVRHTNMYLVRHTREVMTQAFMVLPSSARLDEIAHALRHQDNCQYVVVSNEGRMIGILPIGELSAAAVDAPASRRLGDIARRDFLVARADDVLGDVLSRMSRRRRAVAIIVQAHQRIPRAGDVVGVVGHEDVGACLIRHHRS